MSNAIYDAAHTVIATERDDGSFECQPTPQGKLVAKWLRTGVPALRGEVQDGIATEVPRIIAPSDVMFKLALIEMCERHGWNVHGAKLGMLVESAVFETHAPAGFTHEHPLVINGKSYVGGQFIPGTDQEEVDKEAEKQKDKPDVEFSHKHTGKKAHGLHALLNYPDAIDQEVIKELFQTVPHEQHAQLKATLLAKRPDLDEFINTAYGFYIAPSADLHAGDPVVMPTGITGVIKSISNDGDSYFVKYDGEGVHGEWYSKHELKFNKAEPAEEEPKRPEEPTDADGKVLKVGDTVGAKDGAFTATIVGFDQFGAKIKLSHSDTEYNYSPFLLKKIDQEKQPDVMDVNGELLKEGDIVTWANGAASGMIVGFGPDGVIVHPKGSLNYADLSPHSLEKAKDAPAKKDVDTSKWNKENSAAKSAAKKIVAMQEMTPQQLMELDTTIKSPKPNQFQLAIKKAHAKLLDDLSQNVQQNLDEKSVEFKGQNGHKSDYIMELIENPHLIDKESGEYFIGVMFKKVDPSQMEQLKDTLKTLKPEFSSIVDAKYAEHSSVKEEQPKDVSGKDLHAGDSVSLGGDKGKITMIDHKTGIITVKFEAGHEFDYHSGSLLTKEEPSGEWTHLTNKLGTVPGGKYKGPDGKTYYVKFHEYEQIGQNELLAGKLYAIAGGTIGDHHAVEINGKKAIAREWIDADKADWSKASHREAASKDFAVHAWLANWDAVGAGSENPMDNIRILPNGQALSVDVGGALLHKGGGQGKLDEFTDKADEWDTMRDSSINPSAAKVFGSMTPQQLVDSAKKLQHVSDEQIKTLCDKFGPGTESQKQGYIDNLIKRRDAILQKAGLSKMAPGADMANPIPQSTTPASVPPPPQITSVKNMTWQKKFDAIYAAAQSGDVQTVVNVSVKPNYQNTFGKQLYKYKLQVISAMNGGGVAHYQPAEVKPEPPPKIVIKPEDFPPKPTFASSNKANVAQNEAAVADALKIAATGDIEKLKAMELPPSANLKGWHEGLVATLHEQLHPPPPPMKVSGTLAEISAKVPVIKGAAAAAQRVGFWVVAGELGGLPEINVPSGSFHSLSQKDWQDGQKSYDNLNSEEQSAIYHYTQGGYHSINANLRKGSYSGEAKLAADSTMKSMLPLKVGQKISRKHDFDADAFPNIQKLKDSVGKVLHDKGCLSTSTNPQKWYGTVHWTLTVGPGVKGLPVDKFSGNKGEMEIILPPNTRILVTKVKIDSTSTSDGSVKAEALILPTLDSQCCPP